MDLLENVIQPYAWGSRTALASLLGQKSPSDNPQAELWMGAHPSAPSRVRRGDQTVSLLDVIQSAPERELGPDVVRDFGPKLPFLLKVLAAETPLSLQAHPSLEQAREGFERENRLGIALGAAHRNYKDANHKPEILCALEPFDALCGFRRAEDTLRLFDALGVPELEPVLAPLRASPEARGMARLFEALMTLPKERRGPLVDAVVARCRTHGGEFSREAGWAVRLSELYPGDAGVVGALLLNLLQLQPGEAIYLPAGNLHAYLRGTGVELMANSDNVLRGGCTPKHVDVPELLRVLDFHTGPVSPLRGQGQDGRAVVYPTPTREFELWRITPGGADYTVRERRGPEILLCTSGGVVLRRGSGTLELRQGQSAFLGAADGDYTLVGEGVVFRATVGR
jgi:mannose-6-phosphate isomerase